MKRILLLAAATVATGLATHRVPAQIYYDFSTSDEGWTAAVESGSTAQPFTWGATAGISGTGAWYTDGSQTASIKTLTSPAFVVPSDGGLTFTLNHLYDFGAGGGFHGGQIRYSVNSGSWLTLTPTSFTAEGYDSGPGGVGSLSGDPGWTGASGCCTPQFVDSVVTLSGFTAGSTLQVQFRAGWGQVGTEGNPNWVIRSFEVSDFTPVPEPAAMALVAGLGLAGYSWCRSRSRFTGTR